VRGAVSHAAGVAVARLRLRSHHVEKSSSSPATTARVKETRQVDGDQDDDLIKDMNGSLATDDRAGRDGSFHTKLPLRVSGRILKCRSLRSNH